MSDLLHRLAPVERSHVLVALEDARSRRAAEGKHDLLENMTDDEVIHLIVSFLDCVDEDETGLLHVQSVVRNDLHPGAGLWLRDGRDVPCLAVACDMLGNWSVITEDGRTLQYTGDEVL